MSVRFFTYIPYACQIGRHAWAWFGNCLDKRMVCANCGVKQ